MITVSVIIPCYNHGQYLPHAIESALTQTYTDWEAIVVDDGSTDNTAAVVRSFSDPRIRYIHQENRGLSAARNTGIRAAQGEFLAFLDADDEWEPRFLDACVRALSADSSATAVVTLTRFIDESNVALPKIGGQAVLPGQMRTRVLEGGFFPPHSVLVQAEAVRYAGLFDKSLTSVEDWDLWLRITANGGKMICLPELLARYRISACSMSTNAARMHANRIAVLTKYFGPPDGDPEGWPTEKRHAYGFAYRSSAYGYIQQEDADEGWRLLASAAAIWPPLLQRLDTFYELACGDQPRGYRGQAHLLDIEANGAEMLRRLDALFAEAGKPARAQRGAAYGNAYLALAMLSDQAGDWSAARRYLLQAAHHHPKLVTGSYVRRLAKLAAGKQVTGLLKSLRGSDTASQAVPSSLGPGGKAR